eukprot:snap_masked-scaffold_8-processed-gene-3.58-mRNA-1 protein AED:1.00 eAED:1.00 QI:0/0/0/0/1/1/2/0/640
MPGFRIDFGLFAFFLLGVVDARNGIKHEIFEHHEDFFKVFRTFREINKYMSYMASGDSGAKVTLLRIGTSNEGRPIKCLRIEGEDLENDEERSRGALLTSGVHGREWSTISSLLYVASRLLHEYRNDSEIREILKHVSLHIIPVVNPDGFVYTWSPYSNLSPIKVLDNPKFVQQYRLRKGTHVRTSSVAELKPPPSRLWRPNRRKVGKTQGSIIYGVDLNRNWGTEKSNWGLGVTNIRSPNYQGKDGFSEPEIRAIRYYAVRRKDINGFLDIHCCSKNIIAPFSLNPYPSQEAEKFAQVGRLLARAMSQKLQLKDRRIPYQYEFRPAKRGKFSSGISSGWGMNEMGWNNSYTVELGGKFIMRAEYIPQRGEELLAGVKAFVLSLGVTNSSVQRKKLFPGFKSLEVKQLNDFLASKGYMPRVRYLDFFGRSTETAIKALQRKHQNSAPRKSKTTFNAKKYLGESLWRSLQKQEEIIPKFIEIRPSTAVKLENVPNLKHLLHPQHHLKQVNLSIHSKTNNMKNVQKSAVEVNTVDEAEEMKKFVEEETTNPFSRLHQQNWDKKKTTRLPAAQATYFLTLGAILGLEQMLMFVIVLVGLMFFQGMLEGKNKVFSQKAVFSFLVITSLYTSKTIRKILSQENTK